MSETDQNLLQSARAGDRRALEALIEHYQAQIYRFGMKMCRDPEDAKDVLQDTLIALARNIGEFRASSSLSTWLYKIAHSFCIKKRRRGKFAPSEEASLEAVGESEPSSAQHAAAATQADELLSSKQIEQALQQAILALAPMYREVLLLRDVEGLTAPEVAEVLGITPKAVKSRLHRARLAVRARVAPLLGIPAPVAVAGADACPDVLSLLSRHLEGEISPTVCAEMEQHVNSCSRCRSQCDSLKRTLALCRTSPTAEVPQTVRDAVGRALEDLLRQGTKD